MLCVVVSLFVSTLSISHGSNVDDKQESDKLGDGNA